MRNFKKILILYPGLSDINDSKTLNDKNLELFMKKLFINGEKEKIKFYRAPTYWFNLNEKCFDKSWILKNDKWVIVNKIIPDIIFDRCPYSLELISAKNKIASIFKFVNNPIFDEIASNKFITYSLLKKWMPKSYLIYNRDELNKKICNSKDSQFIIKPNIGQKRIGVKIISKKEARNIKINEPMLLQEFIDSHYGISNIVKNIHDLRVIIFNKKIFGSYVRVAQKGSFLANIAQGGNRIIIKKKDIPKNVSTIVKKVIKEMNCFDNLIYSIDFILSKKQKPYILEINSRPGFAIGDKNSKIFFDNYCKEIIKYFSEMNLK
ncbi:MAG: ATP-grasp domain-containing protein [Patescibacteria group bacterium]|nr:ATP-grasp domain-containing protein [Patescibacteria group bacterium]